MRKLLVLLAVFAAGFYTAQWQHRPIVIYLKHTAAPAAPLEGPKVPIYWEGGGGHWERNSISCVQSIIHCWWTT